MYQGELVVQSASWEMSAIAAGDLLNATVDHVSRFTTNTGEVGYGIVNYVIAGPNERYGLHMRFRARPDALVGAHAPVDVETAACSGRAWR
jgi:hypothetical protein